MKQEVSQLILFRGLLGAKEDCALAARLVALAERTAEEFSDDAESVSGVVSVGAGETVGMRLLADAAARLASSFGGGMARMREVCGSVSGALMVLGLLKGYSDPKDPEAKKAHYHLNLIQKVPHA